MEHTKRNRDKTHIHVNAHVHTYAKWTMHLTWPELQKSTAFFKDSASENRIHPVPLLFRVTGSCRAVHDSRFYIDNVCAREREKV